MTKISAKNVEDRFEDVTHTETICEMLKGDLPASKMQDRPSATRTEI